MNLPSIYNDDELQSAGILNKMLKYVLQHLCQREAPELKKALRRYQRYKSWMWFFLDKK